MTKLTEPEEVTRRTYDGLADKWVADHSSTDFYAEELKTFQRLLPDGSILEIGSGGGRDAQALVKAGYNYLGTDISSGLIKAASKINPDAKFEKVSIYDLNFPQPFDGFWCAAMLIHIPKSRINEALQAIKRNMRRGAIGFITIKEGIGEGLEQKTELDGGGRFFAYWQNNEFKKVLTSNGFEVIEEEYRPSSERSKWLIYFVKAQ